MMPDRPDRIDPESKIPGALRGVSGSEMKIDCKKVYCGLVPRGIFIIPSLLLDNRVSDERCHVSHLETEQFRN